jgi:uncharacterized cofD-like protein
VSRSGPLRIVSIGGGTGLSTLLQGLKRYAKLRDATPDRPLEDSPPLVDLTAVVTVTDDGGSSGRLRRQMDVLPPGDIRNCMVALAEDETLLTRLFQYRFRAGRGLKGHNFGNLFLTALTDLTGDFAQAIRLSSEVLASLGQIFPSTADDVSLVATLANGRTVAGESRIGRSKEAIQQIALDRPAQPLPQTLAAIAAADLITFGPGSLFTSIIPNLLVDGVAQAVRESAATKAYFMNLMGQPGETLGYRASDHVEALYRHAGGPFLDLCVVNTSAIRPALRKRYAAQRAGPVEVDAANLAGLGVKLLGRDLLRRAEKVRHDPSIAAAIAIELALESRAQAGTRIVRRKSKAR